MTTKVIVENLHVVASLSAAEEVTYTDDFIVHGIYFGEGNPDEGGQHWNFTRSLGDDDDGVCTVKESQAFAVYDGIVSFDMSRTAIVCEFDPAAARHTAVRRLTISYDIDDVTWSNLVTQAKLVFTDMPYFKLTF